MKQEEQRDPKSDPVDDRNPRETEGKTIVPGGGARSERRTEQFGASGQRGFSKKK